MKISVELQSFTVPNFVLQKVEPLSREQGLQDVPKYALSDLDEQTLSNLCDQFRRNVFAKAKKYDPIPGIE